MSATESNLWITMKQGVRKWLVKIIVKASGPSYETYIVLVMNASGPSYGPV